MDGRRVLKNKQFHNGKSMPQLLLRYKWIKRREREKKTNITQIKYKLSEDINILWVIHKEQTAIQAINLLILRFTNIYIKYQNLIKKEN